MSGFVRDVAASDEGLHLPGQAAFWSESFYFNFFEPSGRLGGCVRVAASPNHGFCDGIVYLFLPGGGLGLVHYLDKRQGHAGPISVGGVRCECLEPLRRWRVHGEGQVFTFADAGELRAHQTGITDHGRKPFEIELLVEGLNEPTDFYPLHKTTLPLDGLAGWLHETRRMPARVAALPDQLARAGRLKDARHYEQACRVNGRLVLDGVEHVVSGGGFRDHSWGVREWQAFTRYRWLNCSFGEALSFSLVRLQILGFRFTGGFVLREGRRTRVTAWELETSNGTVEARARTEDGADYAFSGDLQRSLPISIGSVGYQTSLITVMTRYRWNGLTAYGAAEFLEQTSP